MNIYREALKNWKIFKDMFFLDIKNISLLLKNFEFFLKYLKCEAGICVLKLKAIKVISVYLAKIFLSLFMLVLLSANFGDKQKVTIWKLEWFKK